MSIWNGGSTFSSSVDDCVRASIVLVSGSSNLKSALGRSKCLSLNSWPLSGRWLDITDSPFSLRTDRIGCSCTWFHFAILQRRFSQVFYCAAAGAVLLVQSPTNTFWPVVYFATRPFLDKRFDSKLLHLFNWNCHGVLLVVAAICLQYYSSG
jgi:hypothetical protein